MAGSIKHYIILNLTVFVWGFTGVIGKEIAISADRIVFFRTGIAFISLVLISAIYRNKKGKLSTKQRIYLLLTGIVVGLHWFAFFHSIKISTVSVAVVCMSSATLFTALLEPLIFKRKLLLSEIILSAFIVVGIVLIIGFEPDYTLGIIIGLCSAFLASLFSVLNGKHIQSIASLHITTYEMLGACLTLGLFLSFTTGLNAELFEVSTTDWIYLLILGIVCTTAAFMVSVWLMKYLTPFTVSMGLNMEPIYAIMIVLFIDYWNGENSEKMTTGFYWGTLIILGSIFINAYLKKKKHKH